MQNATAIPASQQIEQLSKQLTNAFLRQADARGALETAEKEIMAIRNVLAGVGVGQNLQKEIESSAQVPQGIE